MPVVITRSSDNATLTLDATISEAETRSVVVTDHPIEDGSFVTDHAQRTPATYTISGTVTQTPTDPGQSELTGLDRVTAARDFLQETAQSADLVSISTLRYGVLAPYLLTRVSTLTQITQDLPFTIEAREVVIAKAVQVEVPVATAASSSIASDRDVGAQGTKDLSEKGADVEASRRESMALVLLDLVS